MAFHGEAALLRSVGAVAQGCCCTVDQFNGDALAVANVDGCTIGVVQGQAVKANGNLVTTILIERAHYRSALQRIGIFGCYRSVLHHAHMGIGHHGSDVAGNVTCYGHIGLISSVVDENVVVVKCFTIHIDTVDVGNIEHLI